MSQKPDKLRQEVQDATASVNICVVHCSANRQQVCELICSPVMGTTIRMCFVNIEDKNYDTAAETIEAANIVIFALSLDFVALPAAFTTMIFVLRTLKKEALYYLVGEIYLEFVSSPIYIKSIVSLLIGNEWLHQNWEHLYHGPITNLCKRIEAGDSFEGTTVDNVSLDISVDATHTHQYCCCYAEEDWIHVKNVMHGLRLIKKLPFVNLKSSVPVLSEDDAISSGRISCCLICVSTTLARDENIRPLLDKLLDSSIPKVVLVINDSGDSSWLRTGLGLRLADELWVDCTNKRYYLPGEIMPSLEERLEEICVRVKNISSAPPSKSNALVPSSSSSSTSDVQQGDDDNFIFVYMAECVRDTCLDLVQSLWPLPAYTDTNTYHKLKDPFRFASYFSTVGTGIHLECDQLWSKDVNFFVASNVALNKSHVVIQWWSTEFLTSYFCYADLELTLKMFSDRLLIIICLEEFSVILKALKSMPNHKKIVDMLFQLHSCGDGPLIYKRKENKNILYINLHDNEHLDFEQTASHILKLLKDAHHNRLRLNKNTSQLVSAPVPVPVPGEIEVEFDILISYCWANSSIARDKGQISSSSGDTDPRFLKEVIEAHGMRCWLDEEQLGTSSKGLFQGIHAALRQTKCVILFLSDEYAASANCCMEMQYAVRRVPCIVVAVGTGYRWRKGLAGYFCSFQDYYDLVVNPYPGTNEGVVQIEKLIGNLRRMLEDTEYREGWLRACRFN